jgi:hypothetical protein
MYPKCTDSVLPCKDRFGNNDFRFLSACSGPEKAIDGYRQGENIRQTIQDYRYKKQGLYNVMVPRMYKIIA